MTNHILPVRTYLGIFILLLALLAATVAVTYVDLGAYNAAVSLTIAFAKMLLVLLFFMHVRYTGRLIWVYILAAFFWLLLLIGLTMSDFISRGWPPFLGH